MCSLSEYVSMSESKYIHMIICKQILLRYQLSKFTQSAPRNLDRRIENNNHKPSTVYLSCVKGLAERIQKICSLYDIRTVFTSDSTLFKVKPPTEFNNIKNCVYSIPCS